MISIIQLQISSAIKHRIERIEKGDMRLTFFIGLVVLLTTLTSLSFAAPPAVGTITPVSGSSNPNETVTFTTTYTDPDGWANIKFAYLLINTSINGANCFYGYYNQNTNLLYLRNDANSSWVGGYAPSSANVIENSYARLDCAATSVSGVDTTLTINWSITFKSPFTGTKNTYLSVRDDTNRYSGWVRKGTWTIINQSPSVGTVTPELGTSNPNEIVSFTTTYTDPDSWLNIQYVYFLINTSTTGSYCFYGYYNQNTNRLYLRNDAGTGWLGGYVPGSANIIENSYVKLHCDTTTVSGLDTTLTINWSITFKPSFTGLKNAYLYALDDAGAIANWTQRGTWEITNQVPQVGTINPSSGMSAINNPVSFTTTYIDPDSWQNIKEAYLRINTTPEPTGGVTLYYNRNSNRLFLRNNTNTGWLGNRIPGSAYVIENMYVRLNCSTTTVSGIDTTLTINWNITFKPTSHGTKNTYLYVLDNAGAYTEWTQVGTWTIDATLPTGTININSNNLYTNLNQVSLTLSATDPESGVAEMEFSNDNVNWSIPEPYNTTKDWAINTGDGPKTVYVRYKNGVDMWSNPISDSIILDTTPPQNTSVTIDQGEYTITRNITLTLHAEDVTPIQMMISENQDFSDASWEAYSTTRLWTLSSPDGLKTVYAKFMDIAGNESGIVSDTVVLDTTVPELSITNPTNNSYTNVSQIDVTGTFTEINLDDITVNTIQADIQENTFTAQNIQLIEGTNIITVVITDLAGNTAQGAVNITLDTVPPQNPSIVINQGEEYTNDLGITLVLSVQDAVEMAISEDSAFPDSQWEAYTDTRAYTLTTGDGSKAVYAKYRDLAGNETQPVNDSIILDTTPPQIAITLPGNEEIINRNPVEIVGTYTEENLNEIRVNGARATVIDFGPDYAFGLTLTLNEGNNSITAVASDLAGNSAQDIINVELDTIPPQNPSIIINEGGYTNNSRINLSLSADEAVEMLISESINFTNAVWETYSPDKTWILSSGDGDKTIYIKYRDRAQNETIPISGSIVLDTTPPQIQIVSPDDNYLTNQSVLNISGTFTEANLALIEINNIPASINANSFTASDIPLNNEGGNPITAIITDLAGNEYTVQINVIRDTISPQNPSITINEGEYTNNQNVNLSLSVEGATEMLISENLNFTGVEWEPYADRKVYTLSAGDDSKVVYIKYRDLAGNETETISDNIILDTASPQIQITVPEDNYITNQTSIDISGTITELNIDTITVNGAPAVIQDNTFTIQSISLANEGDNPIIAVATDLAGNQGLQEINVVRDTTPPQNTAITVDQGGYVPTPNINLTLNAQDETPIQMMISENQDFSDATWEAYSTTRLWALSSPDGLKTVYAKFMDAAGNESGIVSDTVVLDTTVPELSITNPTNDSYINVSQIDVSGTFTETNLDDITVNTIQADIQENTFTAQNIQLIEGTNTITVVVTDLAGNTAQGTVSIILDTVPPQNPAININQGEEYTNDLGITLILSAQGAVETAISEDSAFPDSQWEAYTDTRAYTLSAGDGNKTVYAKYRDLAGNETETISDNIILDTASPQIQITVPEDNYITNQTSIDISGTITELNIDTITVNGAPAVIQDNTFTIQSISLANEGDNPIIAVATDLAGNQGLQEINVVRDTTPPQNASITIDQGEYTIIRDITLTLHAEDLTPIQMIISENQDFSDASWETYSTIKSWILSNQEGLRTIYVRFRDALGNESGIVQDSIILNLYNEMYPVYSPNGERIVYVGDRGGNWDVWVGNTQLTTAPVEDTQPTWSPDGTEIAFVTTIDYARGIWARNSDGTGEISPIQPGVRSSGSGGPRGEIKTYPDWSLKGDSVVMMWKVGNNPTELAIGKTDGTYPVRLGVQNCIWPSFSPDAKEIVYSLQNGPYSRDIYKKVIDGEITQLTVNGYNNNYPRYSPDGSKIVYSSTDGGSPNIFVMDTEGTNVTQVTNNENPTVEYGHPCFSPDGTKIVYHTNRYGKYDIYVRDYLTGLDAYPSSQITQPISFQEIEDNIDIIGTANDNISADGETILSALHHYILEYGQGYEPIEWQVIAESTQKKQNEVLGTLNITGLADGIYTIRLMAIDEEGDIGTAKVYIRIRQILPPQNPTITVEQYTNNRNITLTISAEGATEMIISEDPNFTDSQWEPYAITKQFTLSEGDGQKTIYVKYRNQRNRETQLVSASIILDTTLPGLTITVPSYINQTQINISGTFTELNLASITVNGIQATIQENTFTTQIQLQNEGTNTITIIITDLANNQNTYQLAVIRDTVIPQVEITIPFDGFLTNQTTTAVTGNYTELNLNSIIVNDLEAVILQDNRFATGAIQLVEGINVVTATITDLAGNTAQDTVTIILDTIPPQNPSISIQQDEYTNSQTITLNLSAQGAVEMAISEDPQFTNPLWEAYASTRAYTLTEGDGDKTVYAKYRDLAGNETEAISDSIILDTTSPQIQITSPQDNHITNQTSIDISGTITELNIDTITVNGIPAVIQDNTFTTQGITLANEGDNPIIAVATDLAGNQGLYEINIIRDTTPSQNVSVTIVQGEYTIIRNITLTLHAEDVSPIQMIISENQDFSGASWEAYSTIRAFTLSSGDGTKSVYVKYRDLAGNETQVVSDAIILDTTSPQIQITSPEDQGFTTESRIDISGTFVEENLASLTINNMVPVIEGGNFRLEDFAVDDGINIINIVATDIVENLTQVTIRIRKVPAKKIFIPKTGVMIGAYDGTNPGNSFTPFDEIIDTPGIDRAKLIHAIYWPWIGNASYTQDSEMHDFNYIRNQLNLDNLVEQGYIILLNWLPLHAWKQEHAPEIERQLITLDGIISGEFDELIRTWANQIADWGEPIFLCFAPEMNTDWHPWGVTLEGNTPGKYIQAYRKVRNIFEWQGAGSVTWLWSPNSISVQGIQLRDCYPGNKYVDWLGLSVINMGENNWQDFNTIFQPAYEALNTINPDKPIIITKLACTDNGGDKSTWLNDAYSRIKNEYKDVKSAIWFHTEDWRIDSSQPARLAIQDILNDNYYLTNLTIGDKVPLSVIRMEANYILACQFDPKNPQDPNYNARGCINDIFGNPTWVVPREVGLGIQGLVKATELLSDNIFIEKAQLAAEYFELIQDQADGAWYNQYSYLDIVDRGKSTTQTSEVMIGFYRLGYNPQDQNRYLAMKRGAQFLISCQDVTNKTGNDDGLVCGGKDNNGNYVSYRYTSDNAFAYQALKAAEDWAIKAGDVDFSQVCRDAAGDIIDGINNNLYDNENNIWHKGIDSQGIPRGDIINFPPEHSLLPDWLNFAPQMLDIPAFGAGQEAVGNWIHNNLQTYNNPAKTAGSVIRYEWDNNGLKVRESPGQFLMADLCWQDLGQVEYSRSGLRWFLNDSNLIQTRLDMNYIYGGSIDWREIEPDQDITAEQWLRFIDTSFYLIAGLSGGYSFTTYNEHAPVIDSYTPTDLVQEWNEGEGLQFTVSATDPDGDTITYKWLLDSEIVSETAAYNYLAGYSSAGWHVVKVIVSDSNNLSDEISWMVLIHNVIMPIEVEITHPGQNSVISSNSISVRGKATDGSQVEILVNGESQGTTTANLPLNINWSTPEDWSTWTSEAVTPYQDGNIGLSQAALGYNDDFNGEAIDPKWIQLRPPVNGWGVSEGRIYVNMDPDEDFWEGNNTAPLLYQNAPVTDYEVTVKVIGTPSADYEQGDLIIYQDDDNYIRLEKASFFGSSIIGASYEIDGAYWPLAYEDSNTDIVYLKIRKADTAYNLYYSTDGEKYIEIAYIDHEFNEPKIGLSAFSGTNEVRTIWFDDFKVHSIYTTGTLTSPPILLDAASLEGLEWSTEINFSDNFSNTSLMGWSELRAPDNGWGIENGRFYINMDPNEDFYEITNTAPLLYQQAPGGDYEVSVKVEGAPGSNYQQAGLIIYQDDDNLLRFTKIHMDGPKLECAYEEDGIFTAITRIEYTSDIVYLRIQKSGERYYYSYSQDGGSYTDIAVREQVLLAPEIGLSAFSSGTVTDVMTFYFDDFNITVNTAIQFQTRTGPNDGSGNNFADWEEWRIVSGDGEIASTVNPFVQIRAIFNTNDNNTSPILDSIELNYYDNTDLRRFRLAGVLLNEGLNTIKVEATDFSDTASDEINVTLDSSPPAINNIILSDQNTGSSDYTTARTINVNISSSAVPSEMLLSENKDFTNANWIPYQDSTVFTLSYGDGLKTVYCKLRDEAGNTSQVARDSIFLDTGAPQVGPTNINNNINTPTTWTILGSPYIIGANIVIQSGASLNIASGVIIKFAEGTSLEIRGGLTAIGTDASPIIFTSLKDDTHGGDTNSDGNATNPAAGDWDKIYFSDSSADAECILENCLIQYGGSGGNGNIHVYNSFPGVQHCSIKWSSSHGIYYNSSLPWEQYADLSGSNISENASDGIHAESTSLRIIDNLITGNGASGLYAYNAYLYISDNTISNNTSDGIHFDGSSVHIRFNSIINNTGNGIYTNNTGNGIYTNGDSWWIEVNYNSIYGNNGGVYSDNTYPPDARYNWWGDAGGPSGIGPGTGDSVNNNTGYEPWLGGTFAKNFRIGDIEVDNRAFNPNNNLAYITGHISEQANWAIKIKDSTDILIRELTGIGKSISQQWDARDGDGNSSPEGTYTYTIEATAANSGVSTAPVIGHLIIDITPPQNPAIIIDEGDNSVDQRLHLTLSCDGANEVILSEDPDFLDAQWQAFASNVGFTVSQGDGLKTVYAKFRDGARNESEIVSDFVTLDMPTYVSGRIDLDTTWTLANSPYIVTDHVYVGAPGGDTPVTLTIEPGVEVRFDQGTGLFIEQWNGGRLNAQGTTNHRIRFTANSISPVPGFWHVINFYGRTIDESTLSHCIIEYGGSQDSIIYCSYSSPSIRNCIIKDSGKSGIACYRATPELKDNNIYNNAEYGLYNQTDLYTVNAILNWWGSSEEPASQISGNIIYVPWLGSEFTSPFNITTAGASPLRFTQNGNYTTILASFSENANWAITIIDSNNNPVRSFSGNGTTISQEWYGNDFSNTPLPDGIYYYKIEATSIATGQTSAPAIGKLELAANIPIARITSPVTNTMFTTGGNIDIIGTAQAVGAGFNNYRLQYGIGENPYSWSTIRTSNSPVINGILGTWNTTNRNSPVYTVRLTVTDSNNNTATDSVIVRLFTIYAVWAEPRWFSPNGDGLNDETNIHAEITYSANWTVTIKNSNSSIVKTFEGSGTVIDINWDGRDTEGTSCPDGNYTYVISASSIPEGIQAIPINGDLGIDATTPINPQISINEGDYINIRNINLTLSVDDQTEMEMIISENEDFSNASWEEYIQNRPFTMSSGEGLKTIYVKYRDIALNETNPVSDSIIYDITPPRVRFTSPIEGSIVQDN